MFVRNGHVAGSVRHSAVPASPAEPRKPVPARKATSAKKAAAPVSPKKEVSTDDDNDKRQ